MRFEVRNHRPLDLQLLEHDVDCGLNGLNGGVEFLRDFGLRFARDHMGNEDAQRRVIRFLQVMQPGQAGS